MILKALYDYYDRMSTDGVLAEEGKEYKEIPYEIVIDKDGNFIRLESTVEIVNNKNIGRKYLIKKETIGTSNASKTTYSFWGKPIYILRNDTEHNKTFISKVNEYVERFPENKSFKAIKTFYNNFENNIELAKKDILYNELFKKKDGNQIIFRIVGELKAVAEHEDIFKTKREEDLSQEENSICLITGQEEKGFVRISSKINILRESKALMVSFNSKCYESYNKTQCKNAPISVLADFKYTTALNYLLQNNSNKFQIDKQVMIFWSKKSSTFEKRFSLFFKDNDEDPNAYAQFVKDMYCGIFSGTENIENDNEFYLLGLSLNKTRIVISFFKEGTIESFATNILQHYEDISLSRNEIVSPGVYILLKSLTRDDKFDSLPPGLFYKVLMAIINNRPYPQQMMLLSLMRIRIDHQKKDSTPKERAIYRMNMANRMSILKAYINRNERIKKSNNYITMSLDLENNHPAYLCGRLFAVIEKCQQEAMPGLNATIKDKYYSAASATPSIVFGRLLQMNNVYLSKISEANPGKAVNMNKLIGEITDRLPTKGFPKILNFDNQSRFALGYYHQSNNFFKKSTEK